MPETYHRIADNPKVIVTIDKDFPSIRTKSYPLEDKDFMLFEMLKKILNRLNKRWEH